MKVYKLTDKNMKTFNGTTQWRLGVTKTSKTLGSMCAPGGFHAYESPELAVLMNPIHANFELPRLFEAVASGRFISEPLKIKYQNLKLIKELELPEFTLNQKIYFAIQCSWGIGKESEFVTWAKNWISGKDRGSESASYIIDVFCYSSVAHAAYAAYYAANYVAASITTNTIYADYLAKHAATHVAHVASAAAYSNIGSINFAKLAKEALNWKE
jgi:hypothetical protein